MIVNRRKKLLAIIMVGTTFIFWRAHSLIGKFLPSPAGAVAASPGDLAQPLIPPPPPEDFSTLWQAESLAEKQPWGRDPFGPTALQTPAPPSEPAPRAIKTAPAPPAPMIVFSGVSKTGDRWLAAVNGTILSVGDVVQEKFRVVEITKNSISLVADSWAFTFPLGEKLPSVHAWTEKP